MPADNVVQFLPRANPKADRAFWKGPLDGPDRDAILRAGAVEIESVKIVDTAPAEMNPDYSVGDYLADYSRLTDEQIAAVDPELEELFRNSSPYRAPDTDPA